MRGADESASVLQGRFAALCDEIRSYPAPIARCDEQLAALLEQRARIRAQLEALERPARACSPINLWINDGGMNAA